MAVLVTDDPRGIRVDGDLYVPVELLREFGGHKSGCLAIRTGQDCDCGWEALWD